MKRFLLAFIFLTSIISGVLAQNSLDRDDFSPSIGDRYIIHTIDYIDPGKEVIWDLSEVTIHSSNAVRVIDPSDSPYADRFPDSQLCFDLGNGEYLFNSLSNTGYSADGGVSQGDVLAHVDKHDLLRFPIIEGMAFKDQYSSTYELKGIQFRRQAAIEWRMIGEGTAIFPFGIMDDVIKIKVTEKIEDHYKVLGEDAVLRSTKESYYFLKSGLQEFVMTLHILSQEGEEQTRYGTLLDTGELSNLLSMEAPVRAVHPEVNSIDSQLNVKLISEWTGQLHISLKNLKGKNATEPITLNVIPGDVRTELDLSTVDKGTYVMTLEMDDRLSQLKVVRD